MISRRAGRLDLDAAEAHALRTHGTAQVRTRRTLTPGTVIPVSVPLEVITDWIEGPERAPRASSVTLRIPGAAEDFDVEIPERHGARVAAWSAPRVDHTPPYLAPAPEVPDALLTDTVEVVGPCPGGLEVRAVDGAPPPGPAALRTMIAELAAEVREQRAAIERGLTHLAAQERHALVTTLRRELARALAGGGLHG